MSRTVVRACTIVLLLTPVYMYKYVDIEMISDVIKAMERPTSVISALCWTPAKAARLASVLSTGLDVHTSVRFVHAEHVARRHYPDQHVLFLADVTCPDINQYFIKNSAATHFRSPFRWLIVGTNKEQVNGSYEEQHVPEALLGVDVLVDGEVIVAVQTGNETFSLHQIYRRNAGSTWLMEKYGDWSRGKPFFVLNDFAEPMALRRLNLNGTVISICYVITNNDTINHLTDYKDDHVDTITKVNFPLTNQLLDFLAAGRVYRFAETWGYLTNGTWNGMIGDMVRGEAEVGGTPMFFTSDRIKTVDFIASPTPTLSKFVFRQPKLSYENNVFLLPFRTTVWYCSVALMIILLIVLLVVTAWEWKHQSYALQEARGGDSGVLRAKLSDVALFTLGAACQQGSPVELKGLLGRVVMFVLFMAFMFLYTSYSANIVALLQSSSSHIRTLDDLLHSRLKFGVDDTVFNHYYFSTATEPIRKAIYSTKVAPPGVKPRFMSLEEGVKNMRDGLFAFHMETGVGYKFVGKLFHEDEKCGLKEIQYLQVLDPWLAVRKNSPYKEMFTIGMRRIQEFGLQDRENSLLYAKRPRCSGRGNSFVSVTMVDCYPALLVLAYGALASLLLLALERLAARRRLLETAWRKRREERLHGTGAERDLEEYVEQL